MISSEMIEVGFRNRIQIRKRHRIEHLPNVYNDGKGKMPIECYTEKCSNLGVFETS